MPTLHLALGDVPHGGQADIHGQGFHTLGQGQKLPCAPDEGLLHRLRQRSHASGKPYAAKGFRRHRSGLGGGRKSAFRRRVEDLKRFCGDLHGRVSLRLGGKIETQGGQSTGVGRRRR